MMWNIKTTITQESSAQRSRNHHAELSKPPTAVCEKE